MTPTIALFTDASFDPATRAAGYGAFAHGIGRAAIQFGGAITSRPDTATTAEAMAIANALQDLGDRGYLRVNDAIQLRCDSLNALTWLWPSLVDNGFIVRSGNPLPGASRVAGPSERTRKYANRILMPTLAVVATLRRYGIDRVLLSHVRGHDDASTMTSSQINADCDTEARRQRKAVARRFEHEEIERARSAIRKT